MKNKLFSANSSFILFTIAIVLLLILPSLLQHGMFMDGTQYAVVARNFAEGKGTFWFPFLSSSWEKQGQNYFLEHPPLIYALQSVFFKICDGSFLSERLYCFVTAVLSVFFIVLIWRSIFEKEAKYRSLYWLPVLLWIITPSVFWSYINNMHENTVSVFVLAAIYFILKTARGSSFDHVYTIIAGIFIFLATLSKGIPGAFPIVAFLVMRISLNYISWKTTIRNTVLLTLIPFLIYFLILYFNESARQSLNFYFNERLLYRINNNGEVENRFSILFWLLTDLIVPIGLILLLALGFKLKGLLKFSGFKESRSRSFILLFMLIGLSGVVPLVFTHVQRAVYFVPALPFFAFALALLMVEEISMLIERINSRPVLSRVLSCSMTLACVAVLTYSFLNFGKTLRDEEVLSDVRKIGEATGENAEIFTYKGNYYEWGFQFYLLRYYHVTIKQNWTYDQFVLINSTEKFSDVNYEKVDIGSERYQLFRKIKGH